MTPADVWTIAVDIFSFGWVPRWVWIGAVVWMVASVVVALLWGPWLRFNERRYPNPIAEVVHRCADGGE